MVTDESDWSNFTVAYDLQRHGASPQDVKRYQCGQTWDKVKAYIEQHGRRWTFGADDDPLALQVAV